MDEARNSRFHQVLHLRSGFGLTKLGSHWGQVLYSPMPAPQFKWEEPRGGIFSAGYIFLFPTKWMRHKFAEFFDVLSWLFIYLCLCLAERGGRTWDLSSIGSGAEIKVLSSGLRPKLLKCCCCSLGEFWALLPAAERVLSL